MTRLSRKEKEELLKSTHSSQLRKDFQIIKRNYHLSFMKEDKVDLEKYIEFLTFSNAFANHIQKPFKKWKEIILKYK